MKILVVADEYPWPPVNGSRLRLAAHVEGLAGAGDVDLVCVRDPPAVPDAAPPVDLGLARVTSFDRQPIERRPSSVLRWLGSRRPRSLAFRTYGGVAAQVAAWRQAHYDLAWFTDIPSFLAFGALVSADRFVVDYDDLESQKLAHRRRLPSPATTGAVGLLRRRLADAADLLDEHRWKRVEAEVAEAVARVLVCSELDRSRLGAHNGVVVPNGYPAPLALAPRRHHDTPTLLFVGLLTYPPNVDAAQFLAGDVLPHVRQSMPGTVLRLVGLAGPEVIAMGKLPGVEVAGPVDSVTDELAGADIAVVPVRFGGGTRVKILEAFAHRLPVVTTTIGCEGLDVDPGQHVLVADDAAAFAAACVSLLRDPDRASQLAESAATRFDERYRSDRVSAAVTDLATYLDTDAGAGAA